MYVYCCTLCMFTIGGPNKTRCAYILLYKYTCTLGFMNTLGYNQYRAYEHQGYTRTPKNTDADTICVH